ncbi:MAG: glycosyltransferase involved in cell wall biosynthesis/predicted SAM-dependent methyltransferase [Desulforhopalus sp.]|jgi:glycosyltransferase involved in cell wall biosynthesis/predicted SAM-dependent methyltransferase
MVSKARKLSNKWLREKASQVEGNVLSIGSRDDQDGEGNSYCSYFSSADNYTTSEPTPEFNNDLILDVRSMPEICSDSYDCIFCSGVLEHVDLFEDAVIEMVRILKPGGKLLLGVPFRQPIHLAPQDFWRFTEHGISTLLDRNGMKIECICPIDGEERNFPATYWILAHKPQTTKKYIPSIGLPDNSHLIGMQQNLPSQGLPVHIVLADRGWILERCAMEIVKRLPYISLSQVPDENAKINYYMNYSVFQKKSSGIDIAFFTHLEDDRGAADRFMKTALLVDHRICMADRYADLLQKKCLGPVDVIVPGVDQKRFKPRLRVGVVGRTYDTGRKGESLVQALMNEPHIEWKFTGSGWPGQALHPPESEMPDFYHSLDVLLVPSLIEGGPMPVLEALSCGINVVSPDVGFVCDYPHYSYKAGDAEDLRRVLRLLIEQKLSLARTVAMRTWDAWSKKHDIIFQNYLTTSHAKLKLSEKDQDTPKRILLCLHAPESMGQTQAGGPTIRLQKTAIALRQLGLEIDISLEEKPDASTYDMVHVFNVWSPNEAIELLNHLSEFGKPIVFSPIYMPLNETIWASFVIPKILLNENEGKSEKYLAELAAGTLTWKGKSRHSGLPPMNGWNEKLQEMVKKIDHLIFLSNFECRSFQNQFGNSTPWSLVHNGVDSDQFRKADPDLFRKEYRINRYVLCVGRIEERKNQAMLARALKYYDIDLVLIGQANKEYKALVSKQNPRLIYIDYLANNSPLLASAYAGAVCMALPSWVEGAPLAALEAAASGCPLILSDRSGEIEYFGGFAEYCDPASIDSIRKGIEKMLALDSNTRQLIACGLRALVQSKLTWEATAQATMNVYKRTMSKWSTTNNNRQTPSNQIRRLEIGSGENPTPGYEHLDIRPDLPNIDYVHDANRPLPFSVHTFNEILAHSNLEHYSWRRIKDLLEDWLRVLKPGGKLSVWMPDFEYLSRMYLAGKYDEHLDPNYLSEAENLLGGFTPAVWALIKTFGGQEYEGNCHYACYDFPTLKNILTTAGYVDIQRIEPRWGLKVEAFKPLDNLHPIKNPSMHNIGTLGEKNYRATTCPQTTEIFNNSLENFISRFRYLNNFKTYMLKHLSKDI